MPPAGGRGKRQALLWRTGGCESTALGCGGKKGSAAAAAAGGGAAGATGKRQRSVARRAAARNWNTVLFLNSAVQGVGGHGTPPGCAHAMPSDHKRGARHVTARLRAADRLAPHTVTQVPAAACHHASRAGDAARALQYAQLSC